jgi:hypothetical protein
VSLWENGEKSVDESSEKLDELHTHLYDFPDPISKINIKRKKTQMKRTSLPIFGAVSDKSTRNANAKLTGQNTRIETGKSMI